MPSIASRSSLNSICVLFAPVPVTTIRRSTSLPFQRQPTKSFTTTSPTHLSMAQQIYAKDQPSGFNNDITKIAIVGATGSVGEYITKHILATGKHTLTAITREGSKSKIPDGVKVAKINYDNPSTIVSALKGQQALIITMATGQIEASKKLVAAASEAGVPWVVPNEFGPDIVSRPDMGNESGLLPGIEAVRDVFKTHTGSSFIGFSCGYWYEFSLANAKESFGFDFKTKTLTIIDDGKLKQNVSTWEQCGRALAALFSLPQYPVDANDKSLTVSRWANKTLHIESFFLSQRDMFDSVLRVTGEKDSDWTIKNQGAKERWEEACGMLAEGGARAGQGYIQRMYARVFYKDGSGDFTAKLDNERLGLPKEDLDQATKRSIKMVEEGYNYFARG